MRVWITGAAGLVGTGLVKTLVDAGHDVTGVDLRPSVLPAGRSVVLDLSLATAGQELVVLAGRHGAPEAVVHTASVQPASAHPFARYVVGNVMTTAVLADALREVGVARCIYTSTVSVYGRPSVNPIPESHAALPDHPYGVTKLAGEGLVRTLPGPGRVLVLRLSSLFGVSGGDSLIDGLVRRARANEPIRLFHRGRIRRDVLYIPDLIQTIMTCLDCPLPERVTTLNLGTGEALSAKEYTAEIVRAAGSSSPIIEEEQSTSPPYDQYVDVQAARRMIGFSPRSFEAALDHYLHELHT